MNTPSRIKVMTDYDCLPLWGVGASGPIDPSSLDLPESLVLGLEAWQRWYDETLNREDPAASGFGSDLELSLFAATGELLATRLANELGNDIEVVFFDQRSSEIRPIHSQGR